MKQLTEYEQCPLSPNTNNLILSDIDPKDSEDGVRHTVYGHPHQYRFSGRVKNLATSFYYCIYCLKEVDRITQL